MAPLTRASVSVSFTFVPSSTALKEAMSATSTAAAGFTVSSFSSARKTLIFEMERLAAVVKVTSVALPVQELSATVPLSLLKSKA